MLSTLQKLCLANDTGTLDVDWCKNSPERRKLAGILLAYEKRGGEDFKLFL